MKNSLLKFIRSVPLIHVIYEKVTGYCLRKKINNIQTSRFQDFTVSTNMPSRTFSRLSGNNLEKYSKQFSDHNIVHYFVSLHRDKEFGFDNNLIVIRQNEQ